MVLCSLGQLVMTDALVFDDLWRLEVRHGLELLLHVEISISEDQLLVHIEWLDMAVKLLWVCVGDWTLIHLRYLPFFFHLVVNIEYVGSGKLAGIFKIEARGWVHLANV